MPIHIVTLCCYTAWNLTYPAPAAGRNCGYRATHVRAKRRFEASADHPNEP
jgi:hypothetical protein